MTRHWEVRESQGEQALSLEAAVQGREQAVDTELWGWVVNAEMRSSGAKRGPGRLPSGPGGWGWMHRSRSPATRR